MIVYNEVKGGRYKYNNKTYDVLFELEGESIKENRNSLNCIECKNNVYNKDINKYEIEKENFDNLIKIIKSEIAKFFDKKS